MAKNVAITRDLHSLIVQKQIELRREGYNMRMLDIANKVIENYLNKLEDLIKNGNSNFDTINEKLKAHKKTLPLSDDLHTLVVEKQKELRENKKIKLKISHMVEIIMRTYIDSWELELIHKGQNN